MVRAPHRRPPACEKRHSPVFTARTGWQYTLFTSGFATEG
jgi:hypothetical protein